MLSLFADDAVLTAGGKTYTVKKDDTLARVNRRWLIKEMKAAPVPEL
jgi:hypothetical protein